MPFPILLVIIVKYMRRILVLLLVFIALVAFAVGVWADSYIVTQPPETPSTIEPPQNWLDSAGEATSTPLMIEGPLAGPAADQCGQATPLTLSFDHSADGGATLTNHLTEELTDPVLTCMFGNPTSPRGYRTAWYQLTAGSTGIVHITTEAGPDSDGVYDKYDTVLSVYTGGCSALTSVACSDDVRGFQSSVVFPVVRGQSYWIEVADYKPGAPQKADLLLSATMHGGGGQWSQINNLPFGGVSRHAFVSDGPDMYVIGGQTQLLGTPEITNKMLRYNVLTNTWAELDDVQGSALSNTTAVRLGKKIYVPGGFNGHQSEYWNVHLEYDIITGGWRQIQPIPADLLPNGRMIAWAAGVVAPGENGYFLTGGRASVSEGAATGLRNVYHFTPATGLWEAYPLMTTPRYAHTAAWVFGNNRGLCVAGGLTATTAEPPVSVLLTGGECNNFGGGGWQPTGLLNFPRYNAGSAIGPDGNWYIFGGLDAAGGVPETEYYDPATNTWRVLGSEFSLGGSSDNPARVWPRGAFWGDSLYVFGGNTPAPESRVISSVDRMTLGLPATTAANRILFPLATTLGANNLLADGQPLYFDQPVAGNFIHSDQFFNAYYFDVLSLSRVTLWLTNVPDTANYNITLYDLSKVQLGKGNGTLAGNTSVSLTLYPGRYFVVVERIFPKDLPDPNIVYHLTLTRDP